jgi:hypothetical protein
MKRLLVVATLLVLGVFLAFSLVSAQSMAPTGSGANALDAVSPDAIQPRTSHTLVQNMETVTANLHVQYYKDDGTVAKDFEDQLAPNGSKTYHANDYAELGSSFLGSMVVSSDRQIVAVVVNAGTNSHDIYEGANQGSTEQFLPSVHWRAQQYTLTGFQNTDPQVTATVAISYFSQAGVLLRNVTQTIPPNAAIHHDARQWVSDPAGVGSLKATSLNGQKITLAAVETSASDDTNSYRGFSPDQGAQLIYLPSIHRNMGGQLSYTLVQNLSAANNTVRITYFDQNGNQVGQFDKDIAGLGSYTFKTGSGPEDPTALGNVGSATVQSITGANLFAVCVEVTPSGIYSYDGQIPNDAASTILFPSAHRNPGGQFSHTLVQNLSSSTAATIKVTYYNQNGTVANFFDKTIAKSGSYTFHTGFSPEDPVSMGNVGSLIVQCTNCGSGGPQIVAIMVETRPGNIPSAYGGFKQN